MVRGSPLPSGEGTERGSFLKEWPLGGILKSGQTLHLLASCGLLIRTLILVWLTLAWSLENSGLKVPITQELDAGLLLFFFSLFSRPDSRDGLMVHSRPGS